MRAWSTCMRLASRLLLKPGGRSKVGQMADRRTEMKTIDAVLGVVDGQSRSGGEWLTKLEKWGTLAASTTNSLTGTSNAPTLPQPKIPTYNMID